MSTMMITRNNIDSLLDSHKIEMATANGKWWRIRRNGATKHWKRDPMWIYIPFKAGLYSYGSITENAFFHDNGESLNPDHFRIAQ